MRSDNYKHLYTPEYMMGPCSIRLLDELTQRYPLPQQGRILDLGCGTGMSTLFTAHAAPDADIFAVDLWISAEDNYRRFTQWNIADRVIPLHANANDLPFAPAYFDAIVTVDAYHYFAANPTYFQEKLLPLVKPGGWILIAVPGLHEEFLDVPACYTEWAGDEVSLFRSCNWWREALGESPAIAQMHLWEMDTHDLAWQDWFASGHKYAAQDKICMDNGVWENLRSIGMAIQRAE